MHTFVLLSAGSSEIFSSMDVIVSLGSKREWPGEGSRDLKRRGWVKQRRACTRLSRLGGCLSETFASMDAFVSLNLQGDGLPDRAQRGVYLARASCGRSVRQSSSSTASDVKWFLVQSISWMLRNSIALTSSRREFRIGCGIIQMKRINRTASGNKIRI